MNMQRGKKRESVWDYPRPPVIEQSTRHIRVIFNGVQIDETSRSLRVLETSHPPVYYIPPQDVQRQYLKRSERKTYCEFKGTATYYSVEVDRKLSEEAAWSYHCPAARYEPLKDHIAFYPSRVDACYVDDEQVQPQPGDFYGGWITSDIEGPFKGGMGTAGW